MWHISDCGALVVYLPIIVIYVVILAIKYNVFSLFQKLQQQLLKWRLN